MRLCVFYCYSYLLFLIGGVRVGFTWLHLNYGQEAIQNRVGVLFFMLLAMGYQSLTAAAQPRTSVVPVNIVSVSNLSYVCAAPWERLLLIRERALNAYNVFSYVMAKFLLDLPLDIILPIMANSITYFLIGLPVHAVLFLSDLTQNH